MAKGTFSSPFDPGEYVLACFRGNHDAVRVSAFCQFAAAVPLAGPEDPAYQAAADALAAITARSGSSG